MSYLPERSTVRTVLVLALTASPSAPVLAHVPLAVDVSDGYTFSGVQKSFFGEGQAIMVLGDSFGAVGSFVEFELLNEVAGQVNAHFPGQGGTTVVVKSGDSVLFDYSFDDLLMQFTITDIDTLNDFGAGLGPQISFTTMADLDGSGEGVVDENQPNLGLLSNTNSMSGLFTFAGGSGFVEHDLGVDLDGDGVNDVLRIFDPFFSGSDFVGTAPNFDYAPDGDFDVRLRIQQDHSPSLNSSYQINPSGGLTLDISEWTMTQTLDIAPVPVPPSLLLLAAGLLGLGRTYRAPCSRRA